MRHSSDSVLRGRGDKPGLAPLPPPLARAAPTVMARYEHLPIYKKAMTACLCLALWAVSGRSEAADEIHYFADERGVPHFSNVPADPRYRLYLRDSVEPVAEAIAARPSLIMFAPPLVAPGSEFAVNVLLATPVNVHGWVEIAFDAAALTLVGASVEHEAPSANVARLKIYGGPTAEFSAELHFRASASRSSPTSIALAHAALETDGGKPVAARKPSATPIAFLAFGE